MGRGNDVSECGRADQIDYIEIETMFLHDDYFGDYDLIPIKVESGGVNK